MNRRIFIAINLPEKIRKNLENQQLRWTDLPCRWIREENLHITLAFLGYLNDEELLELCRITKETALRHEPFVISLKKIIYGPSTPQSDSGQAGSGQAQKTPRMVWVEGESSGELSELQRDLESVLPVEREKARQKINYLGGPALMPAGFRRENRKYTPHITIGRLKQWEFNKLEPEERPQINEDISLTFEVKSIDIMESNLKRGGSEYQIIETCQLE